MFCDIKAIFLFNWMTGHAFVSATLMTSAGAVFRLMGLPEKYMLSDTIQLY